MRLSGASLVPVKDILPDKRFDISFPPEDPDLAGSLRLHGMLNPLWLRMDKGAPRLVNGFRRHRAASKAGLEAAPAIILEEDDGLGLFKKRVADNLYTRKLNVVELGACLHSATGAFGLSPEEVIDQLFPALALGRSMAVYGQLAKITSFGPEARKICVAAGLGLKAASTLAWLEDDEREAACSWFAVHKFGVNRITQAAEMILDIKAASNQTVEGIIATLEEKAPQDWPPARRAEKAFQELARMSKPSLAGMEKEFDEALERLKLPPAVVVKPPENFEGRHLSVTIKADSAETISSAAEALGAAGRERLSLLFGWL